MFVIFMQAQQLIAI